MIYSQDIMKTKNNKDIGRNLIVYIKRNSILYMDLEIYQAKYIRNNIS